MTITCDRADLAWALKAVLPHTLRERGHPPSLEGVHLEAAPDDKTLYVVGCDRYTLGVARVDAVINDPAQTIIDTPDVREMLRRLKAKGECELEVYDDGEVCLDWKARWQRHTELPFPAWRGLLGPALRYPASAPGRKWGWSAEYMARFAPAARDSVPLVFMPVVRVPSSYGDAVPMIVVLGEQFTGLVMSARLAGVLDAPAALRRWRELLPAGGAS